MNIAMMVCGLILTLVGLVGFFKENVEVKSRELTTVTIIDERTSFHTVYDSPYELFKDYELKKRKEALK